MSDIDPRTAPPDELRRWIAERLGFSETPTESDRFLYVWQGHSREMSYYEDNHLDIMGVPNWPENVEAALRDLVVDCFSLTKCDPHWPGAWEASIEDPRTTRNEYPGSITEYAETPAMAICRWYVAYNQAVEMEP